MKLLGALLQPRCKVFSTAASVFGLNARLLACTDLHVEFDGTLGPVVDLFDQPFVHGSELLVGLASAPT